MGSSSPLPIPPVPTPPVGNSSIQTTASSARAAVIAVGFAVFVAADDLTVVTTMLRPIINDLGVVLPDGLDDAAWIVNAYLIAFVAVMPLAGRASDRFGRRTLLVVSYLVFVVGTIVIPTSTALGPLLVGRVLTALGGGAMVPVALAVVGDVYVGDARTRALGVLGAIETFGWVWGPLYGALLIRFAGWRWQFWLNIPLAVVGIMLVVRYVPNEPRGVGRMDRSRLVWWGPLLLAGFLVALSLALLGNAEIQSVQGLDELRGSRSVSTVWFWVGALITGVGFVAVERRSPDPVIESQWLRRPAVLAALMVNFLVGAALVVAMVDIPIAVNALELDVKRAAVLAGWVLASLTSMMALGSWMGGRVATRRGKRSAVAATAIPVVGGEVLTVVALVGLAVTIGPTVSWWAIAAELAVLGLGLGLVFAPSTDAVVEAASHRRRGSAASVVMVVRLVGLSVGLAGLTAWALNRFNVRRREVELPPITDPEFQDAVIEATAALTTEAVADTFWAAAGFVLVGTVVTVLLLVYQRRRSSDPNRPTAVGTIDSQGDSIVSFSSEPPPEDRSGSSPWRVVAAVSLGVAALCAVGLVVSWQQQRSQVNELSERVDALQTELDRVEQGAAGSAIVATQVLELTDRLAQIQPTIATGLDEAIVELDNFGTSSLEFSVPIDETVIIDTTIDLKRDFSFPINERLPIDETVSTTIEVDTGLGFDVPVDVTVPVKIDVPIDLDVDVPIDETVPIQAEVPVNLDVPIKIDMADTELSDLAEQLANGLRNVSDLLGELSFEN